MIYNIKKVIDKNKLYSIISEGRYPNNTVFIDSSGNKLYHYLNGKLYLFGTTDSIFNISYQLNTLTSNCVIDEDRLVMIKGSSHYTGSHHIDFEHTHGLSFKMSSNDTRNTSNYTSSLEYNDVYTNETEIGTIKLPKLYIGINLSNYCSGMNE